MYRRIILLLLSTFACLSASAQVFIQEDTVQCSIYFPQGKSQLRPDFRKNEKRLQKFVNEVYFREGDPSMSIKRILVSSGASPEGSKTINDRLSKDRAAAIIRYLKENTQFSDTSFIVRSPGVDWESLAALVEASDYVPDKDSVLAIIRSDRFGNDDIARRKSLEMLNSGIAYKWMYKNLFPSVRHSSVRIAYVSRHFEELPQVASSPLQSGVLAPPALSNNIAMRGYTPTPPHAGNLLFKDQFSFSDIQLRS